MLEEEFRAKLAREGRPNARRCSECHMAWPRVDLAPSKVGFWPDHQKPLLCPLCRQAEVRAFNKHADALPRRRRGVMA